jgi:hypothetical protein
MGTDGTFPLFSVSVDIGNKNYASNARIRHALPRCVASYRYKPGAHMRKKLSENVPSVPDRPDRRQ